MINDIQFIAPSSPTSPILSTHDYNRSMIQQKSLFSSAHQNQAQHNFPNAAPLSHDGIAPGPPTQVKTLILLLTHFINQFTVVFSFRIESFRFIES